MLEVVVCIVFVDLFIDLVAVLLELLAGLVIKCLINRENAVSESLVLL